MWINSKRILFIISLKKKTSIEYKAQQYAFNVRKRLSFLRALQNVLFLILFGKKCFHDYGLVRLLLINELNPNNPKLRDVNLS